MSVQSASTQPSVQPSTETFWYLTPADRTPALRFTGGQFTDDPPRYLTMVSVGPREWIHVYVSARALSRYGSIEAPYREPIRSACLLALADVSFADVRDFACAVENGFPSNLSVPLDRSTSVVTGWRSPGGVNVLAAPVAGSAFVATCWRGAVPPLFRLGTVTRDDVIDFKPADDRHTDVSQWNGVQGW